MKATSLALGVTCRSVASRARQVRQACLKRPSRCSPLHPRRFAPAHAPHRTFQTTSRSRKDAQSTEEALKDTSVPLLDSAVATETVYDKRVSLLPLHCPGCGAATQTIDPNEAGFYLLKRPRLKHYFQGLERDSFATEPSTTPLPPHCERCHDLTNHSKGVPIFHPSMRSIQSIIEQSPHRKNHIYHVIDSADFPMSLIPNLQSALRLPRLRSQNRRSKTITFTSGGRIAEVSFIITRADLLAPRKEQVDALLPYLRSVLRDSLSSTGRSVRLGNIRCVSAKRGWWTKEVKEDIYKRGGAGWMVGKVNVGKSNLYSVVFPKGQFAHDQLPPPQEAEPAAISDDAENGIEHEIAALSKHDDDVPAASAESPSSLPTQRSETDDDDVHDVHDSDVPLLPAARPETAYPAMPLISSLPGTTASPIRIPFGNGKGELIDLPGVARSTLDNYVRPADRDKLVMKSRVRPQQLTIKPGQSLLVGGGLIVITPVSGEQIFLSCPFVPLDCHVTSKDKVAEVWNGDRRLNIPSIVDDQANLGRKMKSAGTFELKWDVTKQRAGPLTDRRAAKLDIDQLHFKVWAADIVIEGVGWIELVAQVRKRKSSGATAGSSSSSSSENALERLAAIGEGNKDLPSEFPTVEILSPEKRFVALRPPMNAWSMVEKKGAKNTNKPARPRRSMRSVRLSNHARGG